ncbi:MAG: phenylacetate--CoA ligase family protein, partial [Planctomycetes bacterium]|nr:phenylacetate--CoA ligase family protein [Planctomycetota bacterium]
RVHQTSGSLGTPLRWLDTAESWAWFKSCWQTIFRAAGVGAADGVLFPFSFGPFFGFWGAFETAADLGCFVLPCGGMTTLARLQYIRDHGATVVCCTPTYALRMAEVAVENGIELANSSVRSFIVAGEPGGSIPSMRRQIEAKWGARVFDHAGMTEMGAYGFECLEASGGFHINEAEFIAEVLAPDSDRACSENEIGELVLTNLGRWGSPAIRYRTGDQVRLVRGRCACGRWFARAEGGILGRIDDMLLVRGNNVYPSAIESVLREFAEIVEFRMSMVKIAGMDELQLEIEPTAGATSNDLCGRVTEAIRNRFHFRPVVQLVGPGSLPRFEMKARRVIKQVRS